MVVGSPLARGLAGPVQQLGRETAKPHRSNGHFLFSLPATSRARSAAAVVGFLVRFGASRFYVPGCPAAVRLMQHHHTHTGRFGRSTCPGGVAGLCSHVEEDEYSLRF